MRSKLAVLSLLSTVALAGAAHAMSGIGVKATDQSLAAGTVTADEVTAAANGWLVVHRTDKAMKPGPVVGYAPIRKGANKDVSAILMEPVKQGEMLMLMVHGEEGGSKTGVFEYTLGAKEDGPVRVDGKLVMAVISGR